MVNLTEDEVRDLICVLSKTSDVINNNGNFYPKDVSSEVSDSIHMLDEKLNKGDTECSSDSCWYRYGFWI